jgi:hypothetical protein
MLDFWSILIQLFYSLVIYTPCLWISGRIMVGGEKARFYEAVFIALIGGILVLIFNAFGGTNPVVEAFFAIVQFFVMLLLVKYFFNCGWLRAFVILLVAGIIIAVMALILAFIGIAILPFIF